MTKEQEAIDRLNKDKNKPLACGDITIVCMEDLEIVLNLIQEKENRIEELEKALIEEQMKHTVEIKKKDKEKQEWKKAYYEIKEKTSGIPNSINR